MSAYSEIILDGLIEKYGKDVIMSLLSGEHKIDPKPPKPVGDYGYMIRSMVNRKNIFEEPGDCTYEPKQLIDALAGACEEMSYSNWHNHKFHMCAEIVLRYCEANGHSIESVIATPHDGKPEEED